MGKIQCTSTKHKTESWQMIEKYLNNLNTPLEKKIYDEYYTLKIKPKEEDNLTIPKRKKMQRFLKWYKISTNSPEVPFSKFHTDKFTPVKDKMLQSSLTSLVHSEAQPNRISQFSAFDQHSEIKLHKSNLNSHFSSLDLYYQNNQSITLNSQISTNQFERNIRIFYIKNKHKFTERVSKAPPDCYRWIAWLICGNVIEHRSEDLFYFHLADSIDDSVDIQIKKDLNRTMADIYEVNPSDSQNYLYKLLRAFSNIDQVVSYCQGMNFIAGFLLILSDFNEIESFYMMIALFSKTYSDNYGIRGFFTEDFPLLKAYLYVFNHYFAKRMPNLYHHFEELDIPNEVWISKWFQTLYTICLPLNVLVRFWDVLMSYGLDFMINFSLMFMHHLEKELLKFQDAFDIIDFFKKMSPFFATENKSVIHIEEIIINAKKMNISKHNIAELLKEYEIKNNILINDLHIKYDIGKYKTFKNMNDSFSFDLSGNKDKKNTKSTSVANNFSNDLNNIIIQDVDDLFYGIDEDDGIIDDVGIKISNYEMKVHDNPNKDA